MTHVINFDIPESATTYIHRIGRTGRAEKTGDALTLVSREDLGIVRDIERALGKPIERIGFGWTLITTRPRSQGAPGSGGGGDSRGGQHRRSSGGGGGGGGGAESSADGDAKGLGRRAGGDAPPHLPQDPDVRV